MLYSPQVCVFTTFHVVISENESVELFYKVRNGRKQSGLVLGCSLAKNWLETLELCRQKMKACYFMKLCMLN